MNKINKGFKELSEYQDSLATNYGVIDVDRSEILGIRVGWCNHVHNQGHLEPYQENKSGGSLQMEVVHASAKERQLWGVTRCQF